MAEVQFVSDLVMNLKEGMLDFSGPKLTAYYKLYDDEFTDEEKMAKRLDHLFTILLDVKPDILRRSIFARPQILFSIFLVLNSMIKKLPPIRTIERCISELDEKVTAMKTGESEDALSTEIFLAFTSGNMHRIRFRKARDTVIRKLLR